MSKHEQITEQITIGLGARSYAIHIGQGLLAHAHDHLAPMLKTHQGARQVVIIADEAPAQHWLKPLEASLKTIAPCHSITIKGGESAKSLANYSALMEEILGLGITRDTILIALGGGVIGDLVGFMAASLLRGLDFIQIPTTFLAQVDSAVGGKTGINAKTGKNLIGAFHQPKAVLMDLACLETLPSREMRAGYAEVVKYGLLGDGASGTGAFFAWLEQNGDAVLRQDRTPLITAIRHCCQAKAAIVAADETESGIRALLNLGHTFAHAFETEAGYGGDLLHGEAVAAGLGHVCALSHRLGYIPADACQRIAAHLCQAALPTWRGDLAKIVANADIPRLISHMEKDKKARDGKLVLVLVRAIGDAFLAKDISRDDITAILRPASMDEALT